MHVSLPNRTERSLAEVQALVGAIDLLGDRWTLLILYRTLFHRTCRFGDLARELGTPTNVLTRRLKHLVAEGLLVRVEAPRGHSRHEYRPTVKAESLWPVLCSLLTWSQSWLPSEHGSPQVTIAHRACGGRIPVGPTCPACGAGVHLADLTVSQRAPRRPARINGL